MTLFDAILDEVLLDNTMAVGTALILTLALTRAVVPKDQRRTRGTVILYGCHCALIPIAGWFRYKTSAVAAVVAGVAADGSAAATYEFVRLAVLVLAAMSSIGMSSQVIFDVILPRIRLPAPRILRDLLTAAASIVAVFAVASRMGFNLSGIIATSAVVTAVVGFSLQDTLGNIMGGLALQMDNSIGVGDWIKVGDVAGRVTEIRWRYTAVETRNWETVIFPNSLLMKGQVVVFGRRSGQPPYWLRWIYFTVDSSHTPAQVTTAVIEALKGTPIERVSAEPPPQCILMDFTDSGCKYAVRYWLTDIAVVDPTDSAVRTRMYFALKRLGIPMSVPSQHVFMHDASHAHAEDEAGREHAKRLQILEKLYIFGDLLPEERDIIAKGLKFAPFATGEALTKQGNVAHWLYIIVQGEVSIRITVEGGMEREVSKLRGPCFVGEMGLLTGDPRTATIVAMSDIVCYRLDKAAFHTILEIRPSLAQTFAEMLARRRVELEAVKEGLSADAKARRVAESSTEVLARIRDFFGL
ncbi:MAG: mechanosensitive ion channel [Myxococcales bacterium]|nr:mechanosensitive ion channel [Myxococcales bacterium]